MSEQFEVFLVPGRNPGSEAILQSVRKNDFIKQYLKAIVIDSGEQARAHGITGFPSIKVPNRRPVYGSEALDLLQSLIKKYRPVTGGSIDGQDFIAIGEDDEVGFDATKIRGPEDFVIPTGPIGRGDIDAELARLKADRDDLDAKFDARARH